MEIRLIENGILPDWRGMGNAGLDLHARGDYEIAPGEIVKIPLGFATAFESCYVALLRDRGGWGSEGLHVLAGVVDSNYRGEWTAVMINLSSESLYVTHGDRICQAVFVVRHQLEITPVTVLSVSDRGSNAWGSSGN